MVRRSSTSDSDIISAAASSSCVMSCAPCALSGREHPVSPRRCGADRTSILSHHPPQEGMVTPCASLRYHAYSTPNERPRLDGRNLRKPEDTMALVDVQSLVHFSLPVNDLEESLKFYTEVLGMTYRGKVGA